jgi:hypothetical protein
LRIAIDKAIDAAFYRAIKKDGIWLNGLANGTYDDVAAALEDELRQRIGKAIDEAQANVNNERADGLLAAQDGWNAAKLKPGERIKGLLHAEVLPILSQVLLSARRVSEGVRKGALQVNNLIKELNDLGVAGAKFVQPFIENGDAGAKTLCGQAVSVIVALLQETAPLLSVPRSFRDDTAQLKAALDPVVTRVGAYEERVIGDAGMDCTPKMRH